MFEGGADQDNPAVASMIDSIHTKAMPPGNGGTGVSINVKDLLPTDWQTKFYAYTGSLTTPPCSQVVRDESSPCFSFPISHFPCSAL